MGYRQRQTQADCNRCGEPTLHTQVLYEVPNGVYLIILIVLGALGMCLFWPVLGLAVLWLGVWFLHAFVHGVSSLAGGSSPYRCSRCGQARGQRTPEHERQQRIDHAIAQRANKLQQIREREAQRPHLEEIRRARARRQRELLDAVWEACCGLPGRIDDGLKTLAGEENSLIHGFLRFVTISLLATNLALLGWLFYWWW